MKNHAIIPIFISHRGCPNDCVFCNQKRITARNGDVTLEDVRHTIEEYLSTLENGNPKTIELAFFGGSFTGIPMDDQENFLKVAKEYKDSGRIHQIHLSTRPDYINAKILDQLKRYSVDVIELGVQSLDDEVLSKSGRGHDSKIVYESSKLIKEYGFTLGIQLMIGLPADTLEKDIFSAIETVKIAPAIARLYPTVVIEETQLYDDYISGKYIPMSLDDAVQRAKAMYRILHQAGIQIIRVGLKSSDIISNELGFHPAFRQLVEGEIAKEDIENQLKKLYANNMEFNTLATVAAGMQVTADTKAAAGMQAAADTKAAAGMQVAADTKAAAGMQVAADTKAAAGQNDDKLHVALISATEKSYNNIFGHKGINRKYFRENYPRIRLMYQCDNSLADGIYKVQDIT